MKKQKIFDKVATHLLTQNAQSRALIEDAVGPTCAYRGSEGRKCAIGCLIPNTRYKSEMEGKGVRGLIEQFRPDLPKYFIKHELFLMQLQSIHDSWPPKSWFDQLRGVALHHCLDTKVLYEVREATRSNPPTN